ncbi:2Fe-2S iron-sulfur cluster-binding protein [Azohydromonas lata]|uniref:2Fe-2S iron-sulfur cluster-binding protein n=1 Tax=Azohydromonas lata TaxID=45677 RepID=A0ABU5IRN1_9BURK|nr:2Fe-2S iron-sulfur cluster-binding protein [Azohydromonas lata]MDZ5461558.1 2Fe-2S iron-sulfur cluster-binding protein [Azohydromonas lata]
MSTQRSLRIEPLGRTVPVEEGRTLLEAALAQGIKLRSSCRNGTCRECLARIVEGSVRYRVEWPGLSPDEKAEGCTLPCVALPQTDVVLLQPRLEVPG